MAKRIQRSAPKSAANGAAAAPGETQAAPRSRRGRVSAQAVTDFTLQLATLTEAGIPIAKALAILEGQARPGPLKYVLGALLEDVSSGTPLSEAMAKHEKVFSRLYSSMVRAGEAGGVLDAVLTRQAEYMDKVREVRAKIIGAMVYPLVIVCVAVAVVAAVVMFIIPRFDEIFRSFHISLPGVTQFLLDTSTFTVKYWYLVFGLPIVLIVTHFVLLKRVQRYRYRVHQLLLKLPGIGPILSRSLVASFARTFGTLIQAGVPHLDALGIVRDATRNEVLMEGVEDIRRTVREGEGIARPMGETGLFDDLVVNMVDVGEATGELDKMLLKVAHSFERQVDRTIDTMFKLIEPVLILCVAGLVGFIVVALFLPLMEIMKGIQSA
ncbi:MAG: type II secretion system F family protein [Planctomycetes bacterium]|nr:type II secretion system F family protein [Planctomycetota bacterium]